MKTPYLSFAALATVAAFTSGCSSPSNFSKADQTSTTLQQSVVSVDRGEVLVDAALFALSDLVNNPGTDMRDQFRQFETAVGNLETLSQNVNNQAAATQAQGATYLQRWDTELSTIQNEDIRAKSAARRNEVAGNFEHVRTSNSAVRDYFVPFMSRLTDIRTALATDLTSDGIASVRRVANDASAEARPLREALRQLSTDSSRLSQALASTNEER